MFLFKHEKYGHLRYNIFRMQNSLDGNYLFLRDNKLYKSRKDNNFSGLIGKIVGKLTNI